MSQCLAEASACRLNGSLSCAVLQIVSLKYLSSSSLDRLTCLSCRMFLSFAWSPSGVTQGPSIVFDTVDVLCPIPLQLLTLLTRYTTCILCLTHMIVTLSMYVMLSILVSVLVFSQFLCVLVWRVCMSLHHIAGNTQEL